MQPTLPPFTLRQLAYLVAAAEAGTIVGAAAQMYVSPSTMSDAITELERLMGARLCVRRKAQGLTLTSAGIRAVADARALLANANELYVALSAGPDELVGPLAVGCFPTIAPTVLPPFLNDFSALHPKVEIEIVEAPLGSLVELLDSGRLDVAIVYDAYIPGHSARQKLFALPPHVILGTGHRLADAPFVRLEDLIEDDFIMFDAPPSTEHALSIFAERGLKPHIRHRTGNPDVVRTLVGNGVGYGMLIQRYPDYDSTGLPIILKEVVPPIPPVSIEMIWSPVLDLSPRAQAAIEFAQTVDWPKVEPVTETT